MRLLVAIAVLWTITKSSALYEDQALKFDWRQQYIGAAQDVALYGSASSSKSRDLLIVRTESNVLAALNGPSGKISWRQVLAGSEVILDFLLESKTVTSLSYDWSENSTFVRLWNAANGALIQEKHIPTQIPDEQSIESGFMHDDIPYLVHRTEDNRLRIYAIHGKEKIMHGFTTGAGEDKTGFSCTTLSDSYVCVSALLSTVYSTKLPLSGNSMRIASLAALGVPEKPADGEVFFF